ncbi:hypothetical protein H5410_028547 [Solanum commersonii]|uniref:Uncharacterized protein n=1 Tax=Solanum commersonii TaxID=4109 RepID=A0A9J5Z582_SOLCO|nr:hypothetical protein H5410_028547 [Solanum commersonii]
MHSLTCTWLRSCLKMLKAPIKVAGTTSYRPMQSRNFHDAAVAYKLYGGNANFNFPHRYNKQD